MGVGALVMCEDSSVTVLANWIGPAWKTKPKVVVIDRALDECVSRWSLCRVVANECTQLLSGASYGAHGGRPLYPCFVDIADCIDIASRHES